MIRRMFLMLLAVAAVFGGIFLYRSHTAKRMREAIAAGLSPAVVVSAVKAEASVWQPRLKAVGSLRAVRGVDVTTEIAGLVRALHFRSGDDVQEGRLLVELNADTDVAQLRSLQAGAELAKTVYERDTKQFEAHAVSQAALDADAADLKSRRARVAEQAAVVDRKTIRAPFSGRLGITTVNPGQYLNPGDKIVTLQALDSLYVDFSLPQQDLGIVSLGQRVVATTDTYPGRVFAGRVTAIDPKVDPATRNVRIEATLANPGHKLLPGMYATVEVRSGAARSYLTLPQTAVTYNPYGETIYVVRENGKAPAGKPLLVARQTFVAVGPTRGDQVAVLKGIKEGDLVVTSGQLKLKNGSPVIIDNRVQPLNEAAPDIKDQ